MERAEKIGLGVAAAGHLVLFGMLSLSLIWRDDSPKVGDPTVEVTIAGDPGSSELQSESILPISAPEPMEELPTEELLEPEPEDFSPPDISPAKPVVRESLPVDRSAELKRQREIEQRRKRETDARKKRERDAKAKRERDAKRKRDAAERRRKMAETQRQIANSANAANSGPPSKSAGQVKGEVRSLIADQIRPYMGGCKATGPDANKIRLVMTVALNKNGSLGGVSTKRRTGVSSLNQNQVKPLEDCIYGAIRSAAPFKRLDPNYYSAWRTLPLTFEG